MLNSWLDEECIEIRAVVNRFAAATDPRPFVICKGTLGMYCNTCGGLLNEPWQIQWHNTPHDQKMEMILFAAENETELDRKRRMDRKMPYPAWVMMIWGRHEV